MAGVSRCRRASQETTPDSRVRGGERDAMCLERNGQTRGLRGLAGGPDGRWGRRRGRTRRGALLPCGIVFHLPIGVPRTSLSIGAIGWKYNMSRA